MTPLRHIILAAIGMFLFTAGYSQGDHEPTILILAPHKTTADKKLQKEIHSAETMAARIMDNAARQSEITDTEVMAMPENIRIMHEKEMEFSKNTDFFSRIPEMSARYLQYRFYERFNNLLIYAVNKSSTGTINELSALADAHNMQYVLNFPEVRSYVEHGVKTSKIRVQLYDNTQKQFLIEKDYTGDDHNPGFEFGCDVRSLGCTFNNALSQILSEVVYVVGSNNPTIMKEKALSDERANALLSTYYPLDPATEIVEIISQNDTSISTSGFYHGFMDESKTKFIGFFASSSARSFTDIKDAKDKKVSIVTENMTDLDNVPEIYAYIVLGVQYESNWHFEKSNVTYFSSEDLATGKKEYFNNLQKWHFLQEGSSEFNPEFWETYFFSKVESTIDQNKAQIEEYTMLAKKETNAKMREMYQDKINNLHQDYIQNQQYFGLYNIVASDLREEDKERRERFSADLGNTVLTPFFDHYIQDHSTEINGYEKMNGSRYAVIYPRDKSVLLCPIVFNYPEDKMELQYFVLIDKGDEAYEIYRWNYFEPVRPANKSMYGIDVKEQISTVTPWNFSFHYLEDKQFWNDYVLKKSGDKYSYLQRIK